MADNPSSPVVIVTGASSGIGLSVARLFSAKGYRLALAARSIDKLKALQSEIAQSGREAKVIPVDLADVSQAESLISQVMSIWGRIDVLVNNAGYGMQCMFEDMSSEETARMFAVNVLSPMTLARECVIVMKRQGSGSIINVASVGGVVSHPLNVAYCASKHALIGFSKALRLELKGTGIRVTAVCPGSTRTEFFNVARRDIPFDKMIDTFSSPPEVVARVIVKASGRKKRIVFPTLAAWFLGFADRWLPWLSDVGNVRYRDKVLKMARKKKDDHLVG